MGRRSGFTGLLSTIAREAAKQQRMAESAKRHQLREAQASHKRALREAAYFEREAQRNLIQSEKENKKQYIEDRIEEAVSLNLDLQEKIKDLQCILEHALSVDDVVKFSSLRIMEEYQSFFDWDGVFTKIPAPILPERSEFFEGIIEPGGVFKHLFWVKKEYENKLRLAQCNYEKAHDDYKREYAKWEGVERNRLNRIVELRGKHEKAKDEFDRKKDQRNLEVDELERAYESADSDAIVSYHNMVLERSSYPDGFPQEFRVAYTPESKQLVVEYELPLVDIVPQVVEYKYVKTNDEMVEKARKPTEVKTIYQDIVSSIALRSIHEMFESDQKGYIGVVCFNGFIQTVDLATGKNIRPHLISVRTTREKFCALDLARVDKSICLRNLGAQVSPRPAEAQPVKPVIEFDMVDKRFVEQSDILGDLESRPNLIDLNPFEFEHLVANLFAQMGLETKLTRSSKDGGVDCVAFDSRPVLGGKIVIQAKRYSSTVGVSAVRDLYGTMMNEGANKGILVATSGYGPDAFDFCKDKPIELIDGGGLLFLLQQIGIEARIVFRDKS